MLSHSMSLLRKFSEERGQCWGGGLCLGVFVPFLQDVWMVTRIWSEKIVFSLALKNVIDAGVFS